MTRNGSSYDKVSMRQITFCSLPLHAINEDGVLWLKHKVNLPRNTVNCRLASAYLPPPPQSRLLAHVTLNITSDYKPRGYKIPSSLK